MTILLQIILSSIAVFIAAYILPGVKVDNYLTALIVAIVLGLVNAFIRPLLLIITLPINILTLGLFTLIILGFCVWLVSLIVPGFHINNFLWAILFALVVTIFNAILFRIANIR